MVNNIKFFEFLDKKDPRNTPVQILVTCSDDGTIKIYDEHAYLSQFNEETKEGTRKSQRRLEAPPKKERFCISLKPNDNRPGVVKNKKIEAVNVNSNGLIVAGTDKGDVILWKLDIQAFKRG